MHANEYCHWLKGAIDLGGDAILSQPEALKKAVAALPDPPALAAGAHTKSAAFCSWFCGVGDACLSMEPAMGLPPAALARVRERLDNLLAPAAPQAGDPPHKPPLPSPPFRR